MSDQQPTPEETPFARIGGMPTVRVIVEAFYDAMETHEAAIARLHETDEHGRITREMRDNFASFLAFWLGGPQDYLTTRGHPRLRMRHGHFPVGTEERDAWLRAMTRGLDAAGVTGEVRTFLDARFAHVANFLRNVPESDPSEPPPG